MESGLKKSEFELPEFPPPDTCVWFGTVKPLRGSMVPAKIVKGHAGGLALILLPPGWKIIPTSRWLQVEVESLRPLPPPDVVRALLKMGILG